MLVTSIKMAWARIGVTMWPYGRLGTSRKGVCDVRFGLACLHVALPQCVRFSMSCDRAVLVARVKMAWARRGVTMWPYGRLGTSMQGVVMTESEMRNVVFKCVVVCPLHKAVRSCGACCER